MPIQLADLATIFGGYQTAKAAGKITVSKTASGAYLVTKTMYNPDTGAPQQAPVATFALADVQEGIAAVTALLADLQAALVDLGEL